MGSSLDYSLSLWRRKRWEKVDTEKGQYRFYTAVIQQDLWGQWLVIKSWGRIGQRPSRIVTEIAHDSDHADSILSGVSKVRLQHGYHEC